MLRIQIDYAHSFTLHLQIGADIDGRCSLANPAFAGYDGYDFTHEGTLRIPICFRIEIVNRT